MNDTIKWLDGVRGSDSIREVARKIGTTHATLNRQANDDSLAFELVRSISYAYQRPVLADLLATGHLAPEDVGISDVENALHAATDEALVLEVGRRLGMTDTGSLFDKPMSEAVTDATIHPFPGVYVRGPEEDDELGAVARPAEKEPTDEQ
jgi:hypothetical protein